MPSGNSYIVTQIKTGTLTNILNATYWEITVDLACPAFLSRVRVYSVAPYCNEITLSDLINTAQGILIQIMTGSSTAGR